MRVAGVGLVSHDFRALSWGLAVVHAVVSPPAQLSAQKDLYSFSCQKPFMAFLTEWARKFYLVQLFSGLLRCFYDYLNFLMFFPFSLSFA